MNFDNLMSGCFSIVGVILGWWLNKLSIENNNKPKMIFAIISNKEVVEPVEVRTKTSYSEYIIEMVNIGKVPVILDYISLSYKGDLLIDCFLDSEQRIIHPNHIKKYFIMEQDRETLQWHCDNKLFSKCDVIAYCLDGKKIKAELDLHCFYMKTMFNNNLVGRNGKLY